MSQREGKRTTTPPRSRRRTTRRGLPMMGEADLEETQFGPPPIDARTGEIEPAMSMRPTRRDLTPPDPEVTITRTFTRRGPRGEYSIPSARGIPTDVVSGSIERKSGDTTPPRRKRSSMPAVEAVHLAAATKREITVIIGDQPLTLARHDALALAQIILTAFD